MRFLRPLLVALVVPALAMAADGAPDRHVLNIRFDPASGTMKGTDRLTMPWAKSLSFRLHESVAFTATCGDRKLAAAGSPRELRIPRACADADGLVTLEFQLDGRLPEPLISADGIFLPGGMSWYPQTGRMEVHDFTADLPARWSVSSQGGRVEPLDAAADDLVRQRHVSESPADGLSMSAGPYFVTKRQHESIELATFLVAEDPARAKLLLDVAAVEIDRLAGMLGPYPHPKFDIVERLVGTGDGFPGTALIGRDVMGSDEPALGPRSLDHEIARAWLGGFVHVDVARGSWREGLVTYLTDYLGAERAGEVEALNARRRVSHRYSVDVPPGEDPTPAGSSAEIGKASMVFHALRRQIGDESFWKGLRAFVKDAGSTRASWDAIEAAFAHASGQELRAFFEQWIGRPGLPELSLENVAQAPEGAATARRVTGEVVQAGLPWPLRLDVELEMADGSRAAHAVSVSGARTRFELPAGGTVSRVTLDPGFHVPRRIRRQDLPATLALTLAGDGKPPLVVHPTVPKSAADEGLPETLRAQGLRALAEAVAGSGATLMGSEDLAEAEVRGSSILAFGGLGENEITKRYFPMIRQSLGVDIEQEGSFRAGDRRWRGKAQSILASIAHPDRPGATITVFVPNGEAAIAEGRALGHHEWDQWVALDGGAAKQRGTTWPDESATSVRLASGTPPATPGARMLDTIARLADPRLEGREAGSAGAREASALIGEAMVAAGLDPLAGRAYFDPFGFDLVDLPQQPVLKVEEDTGAVFLKVMPGHAWIKAPSDFDATPLGSALTLGAMRVAARVPAPRGLVFIGPAPAPSFEGLDLSGSFAVILDAPGADGASGADETVRRVRGWLEEARRREAAGLIVLRPGAEWPAPPPLAAFATMTSPVIAKKRERAMAEGGHRAAERAAMIERTLAKDLGIHPSLPLVFGGKELTAALETAGAFTRGRRTWDGRGVDVRFNVIAERLSDRNVLGLARGATAGGGPVVIVQAHHDAVGELADGRGCACATNDASGVAVLLEVARRLGAKPAAADVLFATTGGSEWGLQGARHLVSTWTKSDPVVRGVVNIDSVGQAGQPLRVLGRAKWPELARVIERGVTASGLELEDAPDADANRWGLEHSPWSEKGIPAVSLFQADPEILSTGRDEASMLDELTLSKLADAVEAAVRELAR